MYGKNKIQNNILKIKLIKIYQKIINLVNLTNINQKIIEVKNKLEKL